VEERRKKAPAAICRKVAEARDGGEINLEFEGGIPTIGCRLATLKRLVMKNRPPRVYIFYHYFPPDDVVSALHLGIFARAWQSAAGMSESFRHVGVCGNEQIRFAREERWKGVHVRRLWRPRFRQSSSPGRLLNAVWMIGPIVGERERTRVLAALGAVDASGRFQRGHSFEPIDVETSPCIFS
jgi:hypothetical protein